VGGSSTYRCNSLGTIWEEIQVISEPFQGSNFNTGDSKFPCIDVNGGRINVVWSDANETYNTQYGTNIFFKSKMPNYSWDNVQIVSEPIMGGDVNTEDSRFPKIASNLGMSYVVWAGENDTDCAGTDWDIFYRSLKNPSQLFLSIPNVSPTFGNTST